MATVLHDGALSAEQQQQVTALRAHAFDGSSDANLAVRLIDISQPSAADESPLRDTYSTAVLPHLIVQTPPREGQPRTVFAGPLSSTDVGRVVQSPLRSDIRDRLLKGDSVVWVYLESGDPQVDDPRFEMLERELARLQNELELPEIEEADLADLSTSPESLKIQFSAVRLSRENSVEAVFRDMLLQVENDLTDAEYANQPMAFPVFGRGRALYALVGDGLAPDLVAEACQFLTGACQCTVKAENPGVDLLMQVEWDKFIQPTEAVDASLPPLAGFSGFGGEDPMVAADPASPVAADAEPGVTAVSATDETAINAETAAVATVLESAVPPSQSSGSVLQNTLSIIALAGCAVIMATLFLLRRTDG